MERSRQSARECRARKKLRYQYLEDLVIDREMAVQKLQMELRMYEEWGKTLDRGVIPCDLRDFVLKDHTTISSDQFQSTTRYGG